MDEASEVIRPISEVEKSADSRESARSEDYDVDPEAAINTAYDVGRISLEFVDGDAEKYSDYPSSYYTFSAKERLLLIYTEIFRRDFVNTYPNRKPLVLAIPNECGIAKFVSTTLRPSSLLYHELIDCWEGPAQFVADFITFEPLQEPLDLVSGKNPIKKHIAIEFFLYSGKILLNSFSFVFIHL